jgi:F0F1-type ATP synthase membrane subunit b/b'
MDRITASINKMAARLEMAPATSAEVEAELAALREEVERLRAALRAALGEEATDAA